MGVWTDLGDGVRVRQSSCYRMNSGLLLGDGHACLVDPGVLPSELDDLRSVVTAARADSVTLILTHDHWDHVLGRPWWPEADAIGHDRLAAALVREIATIGQEARTHAERAGETWPHDFAPFAPTHPVSGQHLRRVGPWRMVFRDAPGHADTQLTVHLPQQGILFAADMLSDIEIPLLDGPVETYRRTLDGLEPLIEGGAVCTLVPGHGSVADESTARQRLAQDREYLALLDEGIEESVRAGRSLEETQERLARMPCLREGSEEPMEPHHRNNVRVAYERAVSTAPSRSKRAAPTATGKGTARSRPAGRRPTSRRRSHAP